MTSLTDLREVVDVVIGVDTHVHTHSAAVIDSATGGVLGEITVGGDRRGLCRAGGVRQQLSDDAGLGDRRDRRPRRRLEPAPAGVSRSSSSSWTVRSGPRDATARSPIPLMRSEPRVRRWRDRGQGWEHRAAGANAKPCQCC